MTFVSWPLAEKAPQSHSHYTDAHTQSNTFRFFSAVTYLFNNCDFQLPKLFFESSARQRSTLKQCRKTWKPWRDACPNSIVDFCITKVFALYSKARGEKETFPAVRTNCRPPCAISNDILKIPEHRRQIISVTQGLHKGNNVVLEFCPWWTYYTHFSQNVHCNSKNRWDYSLFNLVVKVIQNNQSAFVLYFRGGFI